MFVHVVQSTTVLQLKFVCVCDHDGPVERLVGAEIPHICHRFGGMFVFCWRVVWLGFTRLCAEGGQLLQLPVFQRHFNQWDGGIRSVFSGSSNLASKIHGAGFS